MNTMISVTNESEAMLALEGGAQLIDVKNPMEGSLGANFPWVIESIKRMMPLEVEISATIGDAQDLPGTFALAALGAASCGVDYVKVGLLDFTSVERAVYFVQRLQEALDHSTCWGKLIIAGYGDRKGSSGFSPLDIPLIASKGGAKGCMLDTYDKSQGSLFDYLTKESLENFVNQSKEAGLICALSGSLTEAHVSQLHDIQPDIVGLRGAVCIGQQRQGSLDSEKVAAMKKAISNNFSSIGMACHQ